MYSKGKNTTEQPTEKPHYLFFWEVSGKTFKARLFGRSLAQKALFQTEIFHRAALENGMCGS